jgi:hypothetical protein
MIAVRLFSLAKGIQPNTCVHVCMFTAVNNPYKTYASCWEVHDRKFTTSPAWPFAFNKFHQLIVAPFCMYPYTNSSNGLLGLTKWIY